MMLYVAAGRAWPEAAAPETIVAADLGRPASRRAALAGGQRVERVGQRRQRRRRRRRGFRRRQALVGLVGLGAGQQGARGPPWAAATPPASSESPYDCVLA